LLEVQLEAMVEFGTKAWDGPVHRSRIRANTQGSGDFKSASNL